MSIAEMENTMPRFFCDNINDNIAIITGDDAKHITKVLRYKVDDEIVISDKNGFDYECDIISIDDDIHLKIKRKFKNETEPSSCIVLYQALPKGDKMDFIIQKAVELGVNKIIPIMTKYCVSKPDDKSFEKKLIRYNKIAKEAAKQSGRGIIPVVENIITYETALKNMKDEVSLLFYEGGGKNISELITTKDEKINIIIGSEGGFSQEEVKLAEDYDIKIATLGKRILRCETAPIVALSLVLFTTGNI